MTRTWWWGRTRGLPLEVHRAWRASLPDTEAAVRILAWAVQTGEGPTSWTYCIGTPGLWSWGSSTGFHQLGWHEIQSGGWNAETKQLSWTPYTDRESAARRGSVRLEQPGRIPELFRERVAASIVVKRFLPYGGGSRGVTISARRDLGGSGDVIHWHATLSRGLTWTTEGVCDFADTALRQLKAEFDTA